MPSQPPLSVAASDRAARIERGLIAAADLLGELRVFGIVWADRNLVVSDVFGALVVGVEPGARLCEVLLPLMGLEAQLAALADQPGRVLEMPNVSLGLDPESERINITVFGESDGAGYIALVSRVRGLKDYEREIMRQSRARQIAEELVREKSRELERANRELNEFAHIVSHDLKAPLRAVRWTAEDAGKALAAGEGARLEEQLATIRDQCRRMSAMLNGLYAYSRIGRTREAVEPVDTGELVRALVASIARPAGFDIAVAGTWPQIDTAVAPLELVLRNLVENAIAHHDRQEGVVRLTAELGERTLAITVADDGPGIPRDYHTAVFLPFRKVDDEARPERTGIGLTLVKRTLDCLGGSIELMSEPGRIRGATFLVHWPRKLAE